MLAGYKEGVWRIKRRCLESVKIKVVAKTGEDMPNQNRSGHFKTGHVRKGQIRLG